MSELSELDQIDRMKDAGEITQKQHNVLSEKIVKKYSKKDKALKIAVVALVIAFIGLVLPQLETGETTFINASYINSTGLTPNSGNNTSLISEMNSGYWEGNETAGNPFYIDVLFYNVTSFDAIDIASRYFSSSATPSTHEVELMVWCTTLNDFIKLKNYENEPSWYERTYYVANSHHYIFPNGTVMLKLQHLDNGNSNHVIRIDTLRLIQQPTFREDTNIFNNYTNITTTAGTMDHAILTNLNWANANHTIDASINMNQNSLINVCDITSYDNLNMSIQTIDSLGAGGAGFDLNYSIPKMRLWANHIFQGSNYIDITSYNTTFIKDINMSGNSILNCSNCWNETVNNSKVNKSGDDVSGVLNINDSFGYTGAQRMILKVGRTTTATKFSIAQNDANGAINYRVNVNDDTTQQDTQGDGFALAFQPRQSRFALVGCKNTTIICTNVFEMYTNNTDHGHPTGDINFGNSANSTQYPVTIYNLSGTGNAYLCVDSTGKLYRGSPTC